MSLLRSAPEVKSVVIQILTESAMYHLADIVQYCGLVSFIPLVRDTLITGKYSFIESPQNDIEIFMIPIFHKIPLPYIMCKNGLNYVINPEHIRSAQLEMPWLFQETIAPPPSPLFVPLSEEDEGMAHDNFSLEKERRIESVPMTRTLLVTQ